MPALKPTSFEAKILWLGSVTSTDRTALMAQSVDQLDLTFEGIAGSVHGGATRASCVRVTAQYPKGTTIRNERQITILSQEELDLIADKMGLAQLDPARLGASMVVQGIPDFSHIPPSARLQGPSGASLLVDMENRPCHIPARSLATVHPEEAKTFKAAAEGRRGITASVAAEGVLHLGDMLRLHIPDQPIWAHLEAARTE